MNIQLTEKKNMENVYFKHTHKQDEQNYGGYEKQ